MKFLKINALIILLFLCLYSFTNSLNNNEKDQSKENKKTMNNRKTKSLEEYDKHLNEALLNNVEHDKFYNENDKIINSLHDISKNQKKEREKKQQPKLLENINQNKIKSPNPLITKDLTNDLFDKNPHHDNFRSNSASQFTSATSVKRKKKKSKGKNNLKKLMIPNKILKDDEKKFKGKLKEYSKCKIKKDILNMLIKNNNRRNKKNLNKIQLKPVYVILSKGSLNIQNGKDSSTLFLAIPLKKILRVSQQEKLKKFFCLDFYYTTNKKNSQLVTLCPQNEKEKKNWLANLQEFKECSVKIKKVNLNDKLVYDFTKVNALMKSSKKETKAEKAKEKLKIQKKFIETSQKDKKLFYENTCKNKKLSKAEKANKSQIKNIVKSMLDTFKNNKIREQQVKRRMRNKLKEAKILK